MAHLYRRLCLPLFALVLATPCFAQREDAPTDICQGLANTATAVCFERAYGRESEELRALIPQIEQAIDPQEQDKLLLSEKSWQAYRNYTCDIESTIYFDGGSGHATEAEICLYVETRLHIKDVHAIYDWAMRPR